MALINCICNKLVFSCVYVYKKYHNHTLCLIFCVSLPDEVNPLVPFCLEQEYEIQHFHHSFFEECGSPV